MVENPGSTSLPLQDELLCTYAALVLHDDGAATRRGITMYHHVFGWREAEMSTVYQKVQKVVAS